VFFFFTGLPLHRAYVSQEFPVILAPLPITVSLANFFFRSSQSINPPRRLPSSPPPSGYPPTLFFSPPPNGPSNVVLLFLLPSEFTPTPTFSTGVCFSLLTLFLNCPALRLTRIHSAFLGLHSLPRLPSCRRFPSGPRFHFFIGGDTDNVLLPFY